MAVSAVLDACVLYPVGLRDTLLNVAEAGLYRVLWTEEILRETTRNIVDDTPGLTADHLGITFSAMRRAFPEAMIRNYEHLTDSMTNDPKDRHVLAAAVAAHADIVVTNNLRHFRPEACAPHAMRAQSPDEFLLDALERRPHLITAVLRAQAARKSRPPMSLDEMLNQLNTHLPGFVRNVTPLL